MAIGDAGGGRGSYHPQLAAALAAVAQHPAVAPQHGAILHAAAQLIGGQPNHPPPGHVNRVPAQASLAGHLMAVAAQQHAQPSMSGMRTANNDYVSPVDRANLAYGPGPFLYGHYTGFSRPVPQGPLQEPSQLQLQIQRQLRMSSQQPGIGSWYPKGQPPRSLLPLLPGSTQDLTRPRPGVGGPVGTQDHPIPVWA